VTEDGLSKRVRRRELFTTIGRILPALSFAISIGAITAIAAAQQRGGLLQIAHRDSPASMSPLEEVTISAIAPMMAVFNNLVY
jgi:hypothetical protein